MEIRPGLPANGETADAAGKDDFHRSTISAA
jgi:hypothetical protein